MVFYEFYWCDPIKGHQHIGTLPERRKKPARITQESVLNMVRAALGINIEVTDLFFIEINMDKSMDGFSRPDQFYRPLRELHG